MPTVVILGGGFAGLQAARQLGTWLPSDWSAVLVDRSSGHQLLTRLPDVVSARVPTEQCMVPFSKVLPPRVEHLPAEITSVDLGRRRVTTSTEVLSASKLVLCTGSEPDFLGIPGVREYASTLRSLQDAEQLRDRIRRAIASARIPRLVIVGAGYTATELAGELTAPETFARLGRIQVVLVAQDPCLLPLGNARVGRIAEAVLAGRRVRLLLGIGVQAVRPEGVECVNGETLEADIVVWAARSHAARPASGEQLKTGPAGRLIVDPYLRLVGYEDAYAAGDVALAYDYLRDRPATASAQLAVQQGRLVAENLIRETTGRRPREYHPAPLGEALSLGPHDGAAEAFGAIVRGRIAAAVKRAALARYLTQLGGAALLRAYA